MFGMWFKRFVLTRDQSPISCPLLVVHTFTLLLGSSGAYNTRLFHEFLDKYDSYLSENKLDKSINTFSVEAIRRTLSGTSYSWWCWRYTKWAFIIRSSSSVNCILHCGHVPSNFGAGIIIPLVCSDKVKYLDMSLDIDKSTIIRIGNKF